MCRQLTRRRFVQTTAAAAAAGYFVNPGPAAESDSPNERINIAAVGAMGQGRRNLTALKTQNIVAMADPDSKLLERGCQPYPNARKYADYRVMLEKEEANIDAVLISIPDHSHAPAAAMALRLKKHTYCERPLTHTVYEARVLANLARENNLVTQMGNQSHAMDNYRRVVELVESGAIGKVEEVHVWADGLSADAKYSKGLIPAAHVNWDLWLGPAPERPYSDGVHPFWWRYMWDYGTGLLGDLGCEYMDVAHWALDLRHPTTVKATGPEPEEVNTPAWCIAEYEYPARGDLPPVKLTWYEDGKLPPKIAEFGVYSAGETYTSKTVKGQDGRLMRLYGGQFFVGSKGMLWTASGAFFPPPGSPTMKPQSHTLRRRSVTMRNGCTASGPVAPRPATSITPAR
jgi:predicted dehydrogenase